MKKILGIAILVVSIILIGIIVSRSDEPKPSTVEVASESKYQSGIDNNSSKVIAKDIKSKEITPKTPKTLEEIQALTTDVIDGASCNQFIPKLLDGEIYTFSFAPRAEMFTTFCSQSLVTPEKTWEGYDSTFDGEGERSFGLTSGLPIGYLNQALNFNENNHEIIAASLTLFEEDVYFGIAMTSIYDNASISNDEDSPTLVFEVDFYTVDGMTIFQYEEVANAQYEYQDYYMLDSTYREYVKDCEKIYNWYEYGVNSEVEAMKIREDLPSVSLMVNTTGEISHETMPIPTEEDLDLQYLDYEVVRQMLEELTEIIINESQAA